MRGTKIYRMILSLRLCEFRCLDIESAPLKGDIMRLGAMSVCCLFLFCGTVWAQATAQIAGTVRDESGAIIPGVEIKVTQTATGAVRTTLSNEEGRYVFANLALGPYMLEAKQPGFKSFIQTGIVLQVDSNLTIDVALKVGALGEQVTVEAS